MTATLKQIAALIHRESGIVVRDSQLEALATALARIDRGNPAAFLARAADPIEGRAEIGRLLDEVTVKETFFLRDPEQLAQIDWHTLFDRAAKQGDVRVWSAGCATGEEAYTLALLACEAAGSARPPVRILGTDVSEAALTLARAGSYRARSTRELDPERRRRHFVEENERLVVDERLRALVAFAHHNLVQDPAPPRGELRFDVILCRNVLIYFDSRTAARVVAALEAALTPSGVLILGAADALGQAARRLSARAVAAAPTAPHGSTIRRRSQPSSESPKHEPAPSAAAREGTTDELLSRTARLLATDPFNASAHLLEGLVRLASGDAQEAVNALRKALYVEPRLGIAAFALGRAYEAIGDPAAARRSYNQVLRATDERGDLATRRLERIDAADVAAAARARLDVLESSRRVSRAGPPSPTTNRPTVRPHSGRA